MSEIYIALYDADTDEEIEGLSAGMYVPVAPAVGEELHIAMDDIENLSDRRFWTFRVARVCHELRIMGRGKIAHIALLYVKPA